VPVSEEPEAASARRSPCSRTYFRDAASHAILFAVSWNPQRDADAGAAARQALKAARASQHATDTTAPVRTHFGGVGRCRARSALDLIPRRSPRSARQHQSAESLARSSGAKSGWLTGLRMRLRYVFSSNPDRAPDDLGDRLPVGERFAAADVGPIGRHLLGGSGDLLQGVLQVRDLVLAAGPTQDPQIRPACASSSASGLAQLSPCLLVSLAGVKVHPTRLRLKLGPDSFSTHRRSAVRAASW